MRDDLQHAQQLLSNLAPGQVAAVVHLMEVMLNPTSLSLLAEDEEISDEEERAVAAAREWLKHNAPIPHEQVLAELGLSTADFERMGRTPLPSDTNRSSH